LSGEPRSIGRVLHLRKNYETESGVEENYGMESSSVKTDRLEKACLVAFEVRSVYISYEFWLSTFTALTHIYLTTLSISGTLLR